MASVLRARDRMSRSPSATPALVLPATPDAPCCPPERRWACQVEERGRGRYRVHLSGSLHAGWAGRLAGGLAARRISVARASARRDADMIWTAEVDIEALDPSVDLNRVDFLALTLAHADPVGRPVAVPLGRYAIRRAADDVEVEVRAPDAVGFLDGILRVFAFYGLFPREMRIETRGTEAVDVFRLQSLGGRAPSVAIVSALEARLRELSAPARP